MKRRTFLLLAAGTSLVLRTRFAASRRLLFHQHGHGLSFSTDGATLLAPSHAGLAAYKDGEWWEVPGPAQGFSGFSVAERAIYSSGHGADSATPGTGAGLLRSTDGGRTWQALALQGDADFPIIAAGYGSGAIYVLNVQPNRAMPRAGLFATHDEGRSWREVRGRGLEGEIHGMAAHPLRAEVLAVATGRGLYLSRDGADSLQRLDGREPATAVTFDHDGGELLYARALSNQVIARAVNGTGDVTCLAHSPADRQTVAFATRRRDVFLTRNGGVTWSRLAREGEAGKAETR